MRKVIYLYALGLLATFCLSSPATAYETQDYVDAESLKPSEAATKADHDFQDGKCILYVLAGRPRTIPGTDLDEASAANTYQLILVQGVSDALTEANKRRDKRAMDFATAYNRAAIRHCGGAK